MATKQQEKIAQNVLERRKETRKEEQRILDLRKEALGVEEKVAKSVDFQSVLKSRITDVEADIKKRNAEIVELEKIKIPESKEHRFYVRPIIKGVNSF